MATRGSREASYWERKASISRWQHFRDEALILVIWGGGALVHVSAVVAFTLWKLDNHTPVTDTPTHSAGTHCIDVTSYDYNWDNDMLCTRPDRSKILHELRGCGAVRPVEVLSGGWPSAYPNVPDRLI